MLNDQRTPYGQTEAFESQEVPNYFVLFGGGATTTALDK
jgi:hypothetical protein